MASVFRYIRKILSELHYCGPQTFDRLEEKAQRVYFFYHSLGGELPNDSESVPGIDEVSRDTSYKYSDQNLINEIRSIIFVLTAQVQRSDEQILQDVIERRSRRFISVPITEQDVDTFLKQDSRYQ